MIRVLPVQALRSFLRVLTFLAAGTAVLAQGGFGTPGHVTAPVPERTEAGDWYGTWLYVNRDLRVALWIREQDGLPQVRLRLMNRSSLEGFETDWDGQATYGVQGYPATFSLAVRERTANDMKADWQWDLERAEAGRFEKAQVAMFRYGDGRGLVMLFSDLEKTLRRGDREYKIPLEQFWSFRKVSHRLAKWEELPF